MKQEQLVIKKWQITLSTAASLVRWSVLLGIVAVLMMGFGACTKKGSTLGSNVPAKEFNVVKFRQQIVSALGTARGFSMVINKGGLWADTFSSGWAYQDARSGAYVNMSINQEINVASVSKAITAVGVLQLLKKNGIDITSKIGTWLPSYWNAKQVIKDLTFQELMSHSSGLVESNTSYDSIKATVARGLDNPAKPVDVYANINFALFRAMIPYMNDKTAAVNKENSMLPGDPDGFENWLSLEYVKYMQTKVFDPIGIADATCAPNSNTASAFNEYNGGPVNSVVSRTPGDWTNSCGGGGYYLSTLELARFMAFLVHSYNMLESTERNTMDFKLMGWDNEDSPSTDMGPSYGKDGALYWDLNSNNGPDAGEPGLQTLIMKFPIGIEIALVVNSIPGNWRNLSNTVRNAYNNSWELK